MSINKKAISLTLSRGDSVALIAPASGQKTGCEEWVAQAVSVLSEWGLSVILPPRLCASRYLSADDDCRRANLVDALTHPDIKAIFVTRGGYGCARLLSGIKSVSIPSPRYVVGFSDITTLNLHGVNQKNWLAMHGPNLATEQFLGNTANAEQNRTSLYQALFDGIYHDFPLTPINQNAVLLQRGGSFVLEKESLIGGCLSLLVTSLGTEHEINANDKVLMIEEVGEAPYKIDRMLTHLRNAGKFNSVKAIVFGEMLGCDSHNIKIRDIIVEEFATADFPVFMAQSFGHGEINMPWMCS